MNDDGADPTPETDRTDLPEPVRSRVASVTADALDRLAPEHLPPPLKRVASFAPARRARLAGNQILAVLASDEEFRERIAVHVQAAEPGLAASLSAAESGTVVRQPVDVAAAAYLLRPPGWRPLLTALTAVLERGGREDPAHREEDVVARTRRRLEAAEEELRALRRRHKEEVQRLKSENAEVRRKLGDLRVRLREAEAGLASARAGEEQARSAAEKQQAAGEAEQRRLRSRVGELEQQLAATRRTERAGRSAENVRARLLLDSVVDAAVGLRRELGLPALDRLPADTVAADRAQDGVRLSSGRGSLAVEDPVLLEELLRLPRAHLVVDGYNVTKTAWPDLSLERQRERLLAGVAALRSRTAAEVTVVFDAAETERRPVVTAPRGVRVLFSPFGVIADDVIRELVAAEPVGRGVVVVSSDQQVARDVAASGFRVVASAALQALLER